MWPGGCALQMGCFMQGYLGSRPQLERGALGSAVIAGGVKMKLLWIWFRGNRSMAKGASEDRLAHLSICWRRTPLSPVTACRQRWMTVLAGEKEPWGVDWGRPNSCCCYSFSSFSSSSSSSYIDVFFIFVICYRWFASFRLKRAIKNRDTKVISYSKCGV